MLSQLVVPSIDVSIVQIVSSYDCMNSQLYGLRCVRDSEFGNRVSRASELRRQPAKVVTTCTFVSEIVSVIVADTSPCLVCKST